MIKRFINWIKRKQILRHFKKVMHTRPHKLMFYLNSEDYDKFISSLSKEDKPKILRMYSIKKNDLVPKGQMIMLNGDNLPIDKARGK